MIQGVYQEDTSYKLGCKANIPAAVSVRYVVSGCERPGWKNCIHSRQAHTMVGHSWY